MKKLYSLFILSAFGFAATATATVTPIFTDGLTGLASSSYNTTTAGNFTASTGNVDVILSSDPTYGYLCAGAPTCIDLNGNTQGSIISSSTITLTPGTYLLSFTLNNAQRGVTGSTTVTLGALFNQIYTDPAPGLVKTTITVGSTTSTNLSFSSNVKGFAGDILSGVSLVAAPEPSTALLMSLPLLALGMFRYRRVRA